tara:strand:- start:2690 stop:3535 length:846 start_codon:yes stop_codon:yes gene_type:complete
MPSLYQSFRYLLCDRKFRGLTSTIRVLPNFLVIGVGRGGTTSLYNYLNQHNCIQKPSYDEIGFFDDNYHLGINWYRSMFPTKYEKQRITQKFGKFLTYDVTPWYIRRPWIVNRIKTLLPSVKIIAVLRNPVDRTYSHYHLTCREKGLTKSFEEIIEEDIRKINDYDNNLKNSREYFEDFVQNSHIARGFYLEQLEHWLKVFDKKNLLIISSEDLAKNTQETLNSIFDFLDLEHQTIPNLQKTNVGKYPKMKDETRKSLENYFSTHNENLFKKIEKYFNWNN